MLLQNKVPRGLHRAGLFASHKLAIGHNNLVLFDSRFFKLALSRNSIVEARLNHRISKILKELLYQWIYSGNHNVLRAKSLSVWRDNDFASQGFAILPLASNVSDALFERDSNISHAVSIIGILLIHNGIIKTLIDLHFRVCSLARKKHCANNTQYNKNTNSYKNYG